MGGFLLRKAGAALIVIFLASVLVFAGVRALPGDPALALAAENRDPSVLEEIRHKYGLDQPLPVQYGKWVWLALHGDLGVDQRQLPVAHTIVTRVPITLELAGLVGALRLPARDRRGGGRGRPPGQSLGLRGDLGRARRPVGAALLARPAADHPLRGQARLAARRAATSRSRRTRSRTCATCSCRRSCSGRASRRSLMRQMRSAMLDSLSADYVRTARAKGLSELQRRRRPCASATA